MNEPFESRLRTLGIEADERTLARFRMYFEFLVARNQVMNLTAITDEAGVYQKHFWDSLAILKAGPLAGLTLLDVGAGAGFPSIPLKIVCPDVTVTIIDALQKRIGFLDELIAKLELTGVTTIHGRAEELAGKNSYDLVTARAVAPLNLLTELCLPFAKVGGKFIAMKTGDCEAEVKAAARAIRTLGGKLGGIRRYNVSADREHALVIIDKIAATGPEYPRPFAQIKKKPL